jgi:transcriptional regulator GlxA family with amidase domain
MEFPKLQISIYAFVVLRDATFSNVFDAIVEGRGWLTQEQAAAMVDLSPSQFSRAFHKRYGATFREIQRTVRLELSALVVMLTGWSMTKISDAFHYSSLGKWGEAFSEQFGEPPTQYRERFRQNPKRFFHGLRYLSRDAWVEDTACRSVKTA